MSSKIKAAIIGPGNIGIDLMYKLLESDNLEVVKVVGIVKESEGLRIAREEGIETSFEGISSIIKDKDIKIVFDATSAGGHLSHAPLLEKEGKIAVDLTPAAVGPFVVPAVNLKDMINAGNINMVTCGGQATIPIISAINKAADVEYGEIVATISSKSAGPGTRQSIDEFTETTARGICEVGGADRGKAIIILNPAEPPIMMRDTIYARVKNMDEKKITEAILKKVEEVKSYVPGYRLKAGPIFDGDRITVIVEVEGAGMYLPKYAGNLDIMTAAAAAVGNKIAEKLLGGC